MARPVIRPDAMEVMSWIKLYHFHRGYCPGIREIGSYFEVSKETARKRVKELVEQGMLETIPNKAISIL